MGNKKMWVIGDSYVRNSFIGFMDVLRGNSANPNESRTKGVPEKFVKIDISYQEQQKITVRDITERQAQAEQLVLVMVG